jgi:secretion/DNA translocation related CpaE-like protein
MTTSAPSDEMAVVVATADPELLDAVRAVAAAAAVTSYGVDQAGELRALWARANLVVVGADLAEDVAAMALPRRGAVYLVGPEDAAGELCAWSAQLGAVAAALPGATGWLGAAMAETAGRPAGDGQVLVVRGASGGVGASTVAAGLAMVAARLGNRVMLVDADERAGGLDLLLGAERVGGWRWPRLANARGQLGDLTGQLPSVDGVEVLSVAREDGGRRPLHPEQMASVVRSGVRSHDLVVVDVPRHASPAGAEATRIAHSALLLVHADVRGVAAARSLLGELDLGPAVEVLVRRSRAQGLRADAVADSLGWPLAGVLSDDLALVAAAERGEPPARSARSPLARLCRDVLEAVLAPKRVAA